MKLNETRNMKKVLASMESLPTLPSVVSAIIEAISNPKSSVSELTEIVSVDPALTTKILRIANSAFFNFPSPITTLSHAVMIIGFNALKSIALSMSVFDMFQSSTPGASVFRPETFWKHSIECAVIARLIAKDINFDFQEEAFIAGLIHDIGIIVLAQSFHETFDRAVFLSRDSNIPFPRAEKDLLGLDHTMVGKWMAEQWNLPDIYMEAVAHHHDLRDKMFEIDVASNLIAIVHTANVLTTSLPIEGITLCRTTPDPVALSFLRLDVGRLEEIQKRIPDALEKASDFFNFTRTPGRVR